jgi:penicillin-binding protein 1A
LYNDQRYQPLQLANFPELEEELLADLEIPRYKDILEIERPDNLIDRLFAGKSKEEKLREIQQPETVEEKKGLWQSIKGIFKKKKNR